jgi:hypothetical protein
MGCPDVLFSAVLTAVQLFPQALAMSGESGNVEYRFSWA